MVERSISYGLAYSCLTEYRGTGVSITYSDAIHWSDQSSLSCVQYTDLTLGTLIDVLTGGDEYDRSECLGSDSIVVTGSDRTGFEYWSGVWTTSLYGSYGFVSTRDSISILSMSMDIS